MSDPPKKWDYPLHYKDRVSLDALPWFEADGDRILLADKSVGPAIDMHTHYALPAVWPHSYDLTATSEDSNLLLGCCSNHDLDIYANQNFSKRELRKLKRDLVLGGATGGGKRKYHTAPNLARDMTDMGVTHSSVLAIDIALPSKHVDETIATGVPRSDITVFGSVHPRSGQKKVKLEEQLHAGIRGLKLHPAIQSFHPNDEAAHELYRLAGEYKIPIIWHCGPVNIEPKKARRLSQVANYEAPIKEFPDTTFILGHSGALQCDQAVALQKRYRNVYLEVSCISLSQMDHVLSEGDEDRIMFGSDWPFYHPSLQMAKVLILTEGNPGLRKKVLYDNAARLLGL
jgi:predicted TIM-barrel fold metal-dependent hydrolase